MTTIAASKKHKTIACDRQATYGGTTKMKLGTKIFTFPPELAKRFFDSNTAHMGFSGAAAAWGDVVSWLLTQEGKPPRVKSMEFLVLADSGLYHAENSLTSWFELDDDFFAIGSGMQYAIGAMTAGLTPLEAVKVASKKDVNTGMGYKEYSL